MHNKKIVWLASYPKSGNTWFRAFLTALLNDGEVDINDLKTDGIFSSRPLFDACTDLDSTYLYDDEAKVMQPEVFTHLAEINSKEKLFIKIHDAYTYNKQALPIVPTAPTICALYFIRNPLSIVASLANHNGSSIEEAITLMNDPLGMLVKQKGNKNIRQQFPQLMLDWGKHVESWINKLPFPVLVVRYEDMLEKPVETFSNAARFIGLTFTEKELILALNKCSFSNLKEKEQQAGFIEKMRGVKTFFRAGKQDSWKAELTTGQIELITMNFQSVSNLFNYL